MFSALIKNFFVSKKIIELNKIIFLEKSKNAKKMIDIQNLRVCTNFNVQ